MKEKLLGLLMFLIICNIIGVLCYLFMSEPKGEFMWLGMNTGFIISLPEMLNNKK